MTERDHIERLYKRFRHRKSDAALCRVAAQFLYGSGGIRDGDFDALVREVCRPSAGRWRQSTVACWALRQLEPPEDIRGPAVEGLCRFVDRKQRDFPGNSVARVSVALAVALTAAAAVPIYFLIDLGLSESGFTLQSLGWIAILFLSAILMALSASYLVLMSTAGVWLYRRLSHLSANPRDQAIRTLGGWKPLLAVGPLAREATEHHNELALNALVGILRHAEPCGYGSVSAEDQRSLGVVLRHLDSSGDRALDVLQGIGKLCGGPVLPQVAALAKCDGRVSDAAREILPVLEQRQRQEQGSARLLRPSADSAAALLRPATSGPPADVLLLHAVDSGMDE